VGGEVADGVEGWEVWLRRGFEGTVRWWRWGYKLLACWEKQAGTLHTGGKENMYDSRAKDRYEVGRVYDSLKSFCLRSNHASNPS
jgi:hypothetical protein